MQILQVHFGPIHPERARCMESVRRLSGDYALLNDSNYAPQMDEMVRTLGITPAAQTRFDRWHPKGRVILADWLRLWISATTPDVLTVCTDCEILAPLDLRDTGKPHMAHKRDRVPDYCITYNAGARDWFMDTLKRHVDKPNVFVGEMHNSDWYTPIPQAAYRHLSDIYHEEEHWQARHWGW